MTKSIIAENDQTLADIAIRRYGSLLALPFLAQANNMRVTDDITAGTVLSCPDVVFNKEMQQYVEQNNVNPATARDTEDVILLRVFQDPFGLQFK